MCPLRSRSSQATRPVLRRPGPDHDHQRKRVLVEPWTARGAAGQRGRAGQCLADPGTKAVAAEDGQALTTRRVRDRLGGDWRDYGLGQVVGPGGGPARPRGWRRPQQFSVITTGRVDHDYYGGLPLARRRVVALRMVFGK